MLVPVTPGSTGPVRRPGAWPCDVTLSVAQGRWEGLGDGHGHLRRRRVRVEAEGRGRAARPRRAELWLPSERGPASSLALRRHARTQGRGNAGRSDEATVVPFPGGRRAG